MANTVFLASHYDLGIVSASVLIATLASYVTLDLARQVRSTSGRINPLRWLAGSLIMGTGIWSMHFVGMLGFSLPIRIGFGGGLTLLSWFAAVGASMIALRLASRLNNSVGAVAFGSVVMGAGICAMHYIGMAALDMAPGIVWNLPIAALSVLIAVAASAVAILISQRLMRMSIKGRAPYQVLAAVVMAIAICGMHYTGMAAARFPLDSVCLSADALNGVQLTAIVVVASSMLLLCTLITTLVETRLQSVASRLAHSLEDSNAENRMARQAALLAAEANEMRFRQVLDAIPDLVVVKEHPHGSIIWANAAARTFYGLASGLEGSIADAPFIAAAHQNTQAQEDASVFASGKALVMPDMSAKRHDGEIRRFHVVKSPIFDGQDQVVMLVVVCHDLTDRSQLEAQLHLADRMASVGTLAAGIAHEINTPVQFLGDSIHFLRDCANDVFGLLARLEQLSALAIGGAAPAELAEVARASVAEAREVDLPYLRENVPKAFERCLDGLERVGTIVRSMKEFAHPAQNDMAPIDLNRAIQTTLTIARSEYKFVAELETDFGELPPVTCYVNDINQVVLNIVVNAAHAIGDVVKGTDGKGTIRVRTFQEDASVVISISDTGAGIPEDVASKVFEMFFTTKEVGRGTGQGLALAWAVITEKHGGSIRFDSKVGSGTTFLIRLPVDCTPTS